MELADGCLARPVRDPERAGHPQMHDQHFAVVERGQEILRAAAELRDAPAGETLRKAFRQRQAQIRAVRLDHDEFCALHDGHEAAADGFDFGKLRHVYLRQRWRRR